MIANVVDALRSKAQKYPERDALVYLEDGEHETIRLSFGEIDRRACQIAACLQASSLTGQRVLLLYPTGADFIVSLIGCWYAGVIAVPVACPKIDEFAAYASLLNIIAADSQSAAVMTTGTYCPELERYLEKSLVYIATDAMIVSEEVCQPISPDEHSIAYLQYTSGSTSMPKAAIVTHRNLAHSLTATIHAWHYTRKSVTLTWAPHTHVYGLVCGLLVPFYHGTLAIIMPPAAFIRNPVVWLAAISKYRVSHSGCPDFGYDICVREIKNSEIAALNLKHWKVAVNGGDSVRQQTLRSFADKFSSCGFELKHFCPAYGMSEVTGAIATSFFGSEPVFHLVQNDSLDKSSQRQLVSSGQLLEGLEAVVVNPETGLAVSEGETGEIWLAGASVVDGYWQRPEETRMAFHAMLPDSKTTYFRTGDLGFILHNNMYISGRLKEVIVVYGKKYYPLDFEITVSKVVAEFAIKLPQVAFSAEINGKEAAIIVQELPKGTEQSISEVIRDKIRHAIAQEHGVDLQEVVLAAEGSIPKTVSGKLQRKKAQALFIEKSLVGLSNDMEVAFTEEFNADSKATAQFKSLVASVLRLAPHQIDLDVPLSRYAFDSINIIQLTTRLNETYHLELSPASLYEYANLNQFYRHLSEINGLALDSIENPRAAVGNNDIAVIGMHGVFPQAADPDIFWNNLVQGKDCISEVPSSRWNWHNLTVQWGGFIDEMGHFDAAFFNISPREAQLIDPQQRLFLQTVWKTVEDAGYSALTLSKVKTGLFVGVFNHDYAELLQKNEVMDAYVTTGTVNSMIANRISYILNWHGPSEAIDTACSSSLVAIHQAVYAILQGDCDVAVAGGVNALITPTLFVSAQQAGMLSEDGRCKTFDKKANGYVRGEGAGAILLKKLSLALADSDQIYGVIKGTAVNHGGHVNTLTAPNPNAQAEVIISACQRAHIAIDSINYIETHGTGTPLGDPVEINGLKKAFHYLAAEQQIESLPYYYCGLGSVKTHIGHLESAAGIAGVIKILLAMRYELLPANLHLDEVNPYIDIKESPFYIVQTQTPWPRQPDRLPRRAGISSFGFGGANAHIILEEGPERVSIPAASKPAACLICLSAKTDLALGQRIRDLLVYLERQKELPSLFALSYTLNAGRQHFENRWYVIVETIAELKAVLVAEKACFSTERQTTDSHLNQLGAQYLQGKEIDWSILYGDYQEKISLPVYPFAKELHWIEIKNRFGVPDLLQQGISLVGNEHPVFSQRFSGDEFYLSEHLVNNEPVLPGAVCLEMVYSAADRKVSSLRQIIWKKPIKGEALGDALHIHLRPEHSLVSFAITNPEQTSEYVAGFIDYALTHEIPAPNPLCIDEIKKVLNKEQTPEMIYRYFKRAGLSYGSHFQVVKSLRYDQRHLLAELVVADQEHDFILHPCLLDGVLHTTQALLKNREALYLPFSIEQMDIYAQMPNSCYVYASLVSDPEEQYLPVFNLQVTDVSGQIILTITGFTLCAIGTESTKTCYYHPVWKPSSLPVLASPDPLSITVLGENPLLLHSLRSQFEGSIIRCSNWPLTVIDPLPDYIIIALDSLDRTLLPLSAIDEYLQKTYYLVHALALELIQLKPKRAVQIVCVGKEPSLFMRALAGFAKTLHQEQPNLSCRYIELNDLDMLAGELGQSDIQVRYDRQNHRHVMRYELCIDQKKQPEIQLKKSAVYLITGGLGALGYLFATYLAEHFQAKLVLTGRAVLAEQQLKLIHELEKKGASVVYVSADLACEDSVHAIINTAVLRFGSINGVIHTAGFTHDGLIINKTAEEIAPVLAPKIQGTCYLHAATLNEPLDFFVLFSSVAAIFGNMGQSDYAYANCFMDEFAFAREQQRALGQCTGQTIAINWPFWAEGGIHLSAESQDWLEQSLGITSLSTPQGLDAFLHVLAHPEPQYLVLPGHQNKLFAVLAERLLVSQAIVATSSVDSESLRQHANSLLKNIIAETLKCSPESIDATLPFEHYGIDSLMIIQLNQRLDREFSALPKTLFFEYQTLSELTDYFLAHHASELNRDTIHFKPQKIRSLKPLLIPQMRVAADRPAVDVAIIGLNGCYPQANDLDEFWENLLKGRDCITDIPQERWKSGDYYTEEPDISGKMYSKWGGFLADVDKFDPLFFNISPREAVLLDPQERLFLQTAWKTLEDAGYARENLAGKQVGVYVGVMYGQYQLFAHEHPEHFVPANSVFASIANRVSYFFDFHGPSMALDTMCSSSLTAIHLACQSLREGECQLALAGGVNLSLHPNKYLLLSQGKFLASDGHCRSFGDGGDGYVPGEGVGAVLLKLIDEAVADGDFIYGVIKGSQLNHGGKTNGYTVPNPNAQAAVIAEAYQKANINPASVSYIEAHGTGTSLGDPIEIAGLNKAFHFGNNQYCAIGSVKSNIGHCESAAGIAALTKVLLQLKHRMLVPSILSETLNKNIDWSATAFKVQQVASKWHSPQEQRIAGISSFGAGGANAHLIVAEAPAQLALGSHKKSHYLLTLSAKTDAALKQRLYDLATWVTRNPLAELEHIAYTLNCGRSHFDYRCAMVVSSLDELLFILQQTDTVPRPDNLLMNYSAGKAKGHATLTQDLQQNYHYRDTLLAYAKSYVEGAIPDWHALHAEESKRKIPLPTYPFAKERYWYSDEINNAPLPSDRAKQSGISDNVLSFITRQVKLILNITQHDLEAEKSLGDYGMDSVHFIELAKRLAEQYQIEFTPAVFYTYYSVKGIADYIMSHLADTEVSARHFQVPVSGQTLFDPEDQIAIIGMQGIFPQSDNLADFWQHLSEGHDLVTEIPAERWDWRNYADKSNSRWGGFIPNMDLFDAGFFNISAREANLMDPQQRLFLETAWKTIEDAGYNPFALGSHKVGVFAGVEFSEYQTLIANQQKEFHGFIATGNSHSMIANRVSYFFDFQGPSEAIDTACSSSLVAIHRAVRAIRYGECELAIAGGVSLILNPDTVVIISQLGALSADGRCKTFDQSANGYVKGEGVGCLLLKYLKQAKLDGDHIYGVIKASAVNHGGKAQSLTAPNAAAQMELLVSAYQQAHIDPATVTYIETHGTGTALGDPIEIEGLKQAFNALLKPRFNNARIALGSVKTNIGHLEPASGIAGVMKVILSMTHHKMPKMLHLQELNSYINLADSPFYIAKEATDWLRIKDESGRDIPLRAGVSSFGFGGTNAHVVLEEGAPHQSGYALTQSKPYYLVTLSAKQQQSLQQKIIELQQWLIDHYETTSLEALSFTLNAGRTHFVYRCALVVSSVEELMAALIQLSQQEIPEYCMINEGQTCNMQGPVFDEVYETAISALQQTEHSASYRHKLFILADLYTKHYPIDWVLLHDHEQKKRVPSLPSYPFIKQRYWFDAELQASPTAQIPSAAPKMISPDFPSQVLAYLQSVFAEKLHTLPEAIETNQTYEVYGVDSVIGLEITNRLENDFGTLPKTLLYERNRLNDLAKFFIKNHEKQLHDLLANVETLPLILLEEQDELAQNHFPMELQTPCSRDIAIIGLSGIFPMSANMDEFWHNLINARDCVGEVPADRWDYKKYPVWTGGSEKVFPHGGFIPDVDKFDPLFFSISPRDAGFMDPQERLFMQSVWSTLEDAGYTREKIRRQAQNSVGVFAGVTYNFYPLFIAEEWQKGNQVPLDIQSFSVANRISYFLDINGPSFVVDTACSSSLAAIHLACDSMLKGDCRMAIAGGVNLSLHPAKYHFLGSFNFMSEQGRCTSFAEGGTGYVPSEGVGAVLLKPLADAVADKDLIYAVIKGSSMNHGGKTSGYTVPNPNAQTEVILKALRSAHIDPRTISYIEAHGTGTSLGDPIEIRGLQEAFESYTDDRQYCAIGSVKSNIGHLESAAGISQLAKVLLQMRHKKLVPSLHAEQLNSFIDFKNSPFYLQRELSDWQPKHGIPRRAGISSFGAGGANVHMIVEEYSPKMEVSSPTNGPYLFLLSALNEERLHAQVQQMHRYIQNNSHTQEPEWLRNACYTLQTGREHMNARLAIKASSWQELLTALEMYPQSSPNIWVNTQVQSMPKRINQLTGLSEDELAQSWVGGATLEWKQYDMRHSGYIISLPTYPFTKRRCWIPTKEVDLPVLSESVADVPSFDCQEWLYMTQWEPSSQEIFAQESENKGAWLIFSDQQSRSWIQEQFSAEGCVYCHPGEQFALLGQNIYAINPTSQADFKALFSAVYMSHGQHLKGVIYLCAGSEAAQTDTSMELLYLFKSMTQCSWSQQLIFCLVSQSAQQVNSSDVINIWQHHLWSMTRIFAAEQASYQIMLLDLDAQQSSAQNASTIVRELAYPQVNQNHIAYRANQRYTLRLSVQPPLQEKKPLWIAPVAALITGGLGALGYEVAEYLVSRGTRFVLLTGTTELSACTQEKNNWLKQLQDKGAEVRYAAVDVSDYESMRMLIADTEKNWQCTIDGVFHLAGVTTDNVPMALMDETLWRDVLKVKIQGSLVLHEIFSQARLSAFVLFSSIAAVPYFGMAGLSAYAVANEFMSGLACYRRSCQMPAISINWVAWSEKGMSHRHNHDAFLEAVGMASLSIKQGMALFNDILVRNPAEVTVCKIQWKKFLQINATAKQLDFFSHFVNEYTSIPAVAEACNVTQDKIPALVQELFARVLVLEPGEIDEDTPFQQYGLDSISGIGYTEELSKHFPDVVAPTDLYRYPTLKQLSDYIIQGVCQHQDKTSASAWHIQDIVDLDQLSATQLNELIEAELHELELNYD